MIRTNGRNGFTLVELLVVVGMIAVLMGAMTTSARAARHRARVQKATSDVKVISQAILAYENYNRNGSSYKLPTLTRAEAGKDSLGFLLGASGTTLSGERIPTLLQTALTTGGKILDPWGHPYLVTIRSGGATLKTETATGSLNTGYALPNFYRLSEDER